MKIDLSKTNGASPPTDVLNHLQPFSANVRYDEDIWTVDDVAHYLKLSQRQVWELTRRRGQERSPRPIPCFKIHSKCLRFRKSDVQAWLETLAQRVRVQ